MKVLILLALIGAAAAVPRRGNRIVGGSPTTIDQYPFMSNMQLRWAPNWWMQACGGTLITTVSVLSAAHCFEFDSTSWRVVLGSTLAAGGGSVHMISRIINHPDYDNIPNDSDVAIVRLALPAQYTPNIQPARIPSASSIISDGRVVTAIGWGDLYHNGPSPDQLHHVDVNVINQELCAERYAYLKTQPGYERWPDITPTMLCTGILDVGGKDACQGDSGGPVVIERNIVVGVTSWGFRCAEPFYPGVNARVTSFTNWIVDNA